MTLITDLLFAPIVDEGTRYGSCEFDTQKDDEEVEVS